MRLLFLRKCVSLMLISGFIFGTLYADELGGDFEDIDNADELLTIPPEYDDDEEYAECGSDNERVRADSLPIDSFEGSCELYLEGYIQALVDVHYYEFQVVVSVRDNTVYLANLPNNDLIASSIISFVQDLPDVCDVEVRCEMTEEEKAIREEYVGKPQVNGIWFPQSTVLFLPLIADPRQPINSANLRFGDKIAGYQAVAVSLGDDFPIFRWRDVLPWHGDMQIGIEAGIWAIFNFKDKPHNDNGDVCKLVNTDYFVGIPLTYAFDKWSFRLRGYHISSHLGDEFLCEAPDWVKKRTNPSFEAIDFFTSYQFSSGLRGYFGPGVIVHSDKSFKLKPLYVEYGMELRMFGRKLYYHKLYGTPFFAMNLENWQQHGWSLDSTYMIGYEWSKLQGIGRKMRLYGEYHQGFSYEGQFFNERVKYAQLGFSWGF